MEAKRKKFTVQDYYAEAITIGGLPTTRGAFIKEMRAAGHPQRQIDIYLFGLDQGHEIRLRAEQRRVEASIKEVTL